MLGTNIVKGEEFRKIQQDTLHVIKDSLLNTFGPNGSTTMIKKAPGEFAITTKDGHTVLSNIKFTGVIESTVVQELNELTTHIVKTVGDGTTSAIILSSIIFDNLVEKELQGHPSAIIRAFKEAVEEIIERIDENNEATKEVTLEDIYDIALTSTNNNELIANYLYDIYATTYFNKFINDVFNNNFDLTTKDKIIQQIAKFDFRLIDDYTVQKIYSLMNSTTKEFHMDKDDFFDLVEAKMEMSCKGCTKDRNECELRQFLEDRFVPPINEGSQCNCEYSY